jgi:glycosyltransferase involved in cell wall biosynthesis
VTAPVRQPLVSVLLPARNAATTIGAAVSSTLAQSLHEWELLVVDDGSSDGTPEAAEVAARGDPRVRVLRRTHQGIVGALEAARREARGRFIARMDADDWMYPERLEAQAELMHAYPETGVASCLVEFGGDADVARGYALHVEWINSLLEAEAIARERFVEAPVAHPSVMFRREIAETHGGYAETGGPEDYEVWLRWMDAGVRFAKVPEVLLRWNDPPGRLSRVDARYSDDAFYACKCRWLARWVQREIARDRPVWLWGAGRVTRRRFAALAEHGVRVGAYVDVDPRKIGGRADGLVVVGPEGLPPPGRVFVIGAVGARGARDLVRGALESRGYVAGRDFLMAA